MTSPINDNTILPIYKYGIPIHTNLLYRLSKEQENSNVEI